MTTYFNFGKVGASLGQLRDSRRRSRDTSNLRAVGVITRILSANIVPLTPSRAGPRTRGHGRGHVASLVGRDGVHLLVQKLQLALTLSLLTHLTLLALLLFLPFGPEFLLLLLALLVEPQSSGLVVAALARLGVRVGDGSFSGRGRAGDGGAVAIGNDVRGGARAGWGETIASKSPDITIIQGEFLKRVCRSDITVLALLSVWRLVFCLIF